MTFVMINKQVDGIHHTVQPDLSSTYDALSTDGSGGGRFK